MPEKTIRQIAKLAGVSPATASLALRQSPKISKATIARVQQIAADENYRINPMVSSLMAHLRATRPITQYTASIAFVTPYKVSHLTQAPWDAPAQVFHGAKNRAAAHGYTMEEIPFRDLGISAHRLNKILRTRNISAVIIHHLTDLAEFADLDWPQFSLISLGSGTIHPRLHHVHTDHFQIPLKAMDEARKLGYQRPGLFLRPFLNSVTEHRYVGGYLLAQQSFKKANRIPPLISSEEEEVVFRKWLLKHRPDVVLTGNYRIQKWILNAGLKIPEQIGLIHLDVSPDKSDCSGIYQNREMVSWAAVDLVISEHQRNERGIPALPKTTLIEGSWIEGKTLCQQVH